MGMRKCYWKLEEWGSILYSGRALGKTVLKTELVSDEPDTPKENVKGIVIWYIKSAQAAITKGDRLDGVSNRNLFLIGLEAGKSKIKVSAR